MELVITRTITDHPLYGERCVRYAIGVISQQLLQLLLILKVTTRWLAEFGDEALVGRVAINRGSWSTAGKIPLWWPKRGYSCDRSVTSVEYGA